MKFSCVVSYHTNALTCGVARFSQELANRLGVPFVGDGNEIGTCPLYSLKWSEIDPERDYWFTSIPGKYGVLWHDEGHEAVTRKATWVMYANPSLGSPSVWCPPVIADLPVPKPSHLKILTACMAHKLDAAPYERLRALLDSTPHTAQLRVSVAIHEGTTLNDAELHFNALKAVMGRHHVYVMGCLTDEALARELRKSLAVAAFYPKGVRANNTTAHAAMSQGRALITNLDAYSPKDFIHNETCFDIHQMTEWPSLPKIDRVAKNGRDLYDSTYHWTHLVSRIEELCVASR
jgi:hypothetical protein